MSPRTRRLSRHGRRTRDTLNAQQWAELDEEMLAGWLLRCSPSLCSGPRIARDACAVCPGLPGRTDAMRLVREIEARRAEREFAGIYAQHRAAMKNSTDNMNEGNTDD